MHRLQVLRKLRHPGLTSTLVHREVLTTILEKVINPPLDDKQAYKLVLLCSPAGYGKTTLLADIARHTSIPCCWYFLDANDTNKITFIELLLTSLRQCFPHFCTEVETILAALKVDALTEAVPLYQFEALLEKIMASFEDEIQQQFAIFLCNYHEVNADADINHLVNFFLCHLPPNCVLVIESRATPALDLGVLLARQQMFGIGQHHLRFTTQDLCELIRLQGKYDISEEDVQQMITVFDGWIMGILLGTHLGSFQLRAMSKLSVPEQTSSSIQINRRILLTYVLQEIFHDEPDAYDFLRDVSILRQMTDEMCNSLLSITDAEKKLAYVYEQGLFVTYNDTEAQRIYICHPIIRELLCDELRLHNPERFMHLHTQAAFLYRATEDYEQAITHALQTNQEQLAADLIIQVSRFMLIQGYSETIKHWIDTLSHSTVKYYPQLLLSRANIHLLEYEAVQAKELLDQAIAALANPELKLDEASLPVLKAEILISCGGAAFDIGAYKEGIELCQQALTLLPPDEKVLRAMAFSRIGSCKARLGDSSSAITELQIALQLWGHNTQTRQVALLHSRLAASYNFIGNYALAEHHRSRSIQCFEYLDDRRGVIMGLIGAGCTHLDKGAFQDAEAFMQKALSEARSTHLEICEAYTLVNLGEIYQMQGLYGRALPLFEDALTLAQRQNDSYLVNCTLCHFSLNYLFMGDVTTALLLLKQIHEKINAHISYERMLCELTHGTIFLVQQDYVHASAILSSVATILFTTGLKSLQVSTLLRLSVCHLAQNETIALQQTSQKAHRLIVEGNYEHILSSEKQRFPQLLKIMPPLSQQEISTDVSPLLALPHIESNTFPEVNLIISAAKISPSLLIQALGEPTVTINNTPITHWRMARSMELYFYLLNCPHPVHKEQIIDALWSEIEDNADQTLRSTVYYLRQVVGKSSVVYRGGAYSLDFSDLYANDVQYDVATFLKLHKQAQEARERKEDDVARTLLTQTVSLYRGDYVQSFYRNWCSARRDELRHVYLDARRLLALLCWQGELFDESITHWQYMLAIDNCLEEAHYGVMRCYARQGKRGQALRQHQRCTEILRDELSVAPGSSIQKLYQRLTSNDSL